MTLTLPKNHVYLLCLYMMQEGTLRTSADFRLSEAYAAADGTVTMNMDDGATVTHDA